MTACQARGDRLNHGDPFLRLSGACWEQGRSSGRWCEFDRSYGSRSSRPSRGLPVRRVVPNVALRGGERQRMAGAASFAAARARFPLHRGRPSSAARRRRMLAAAHLRGASSRRQPLAVGRSGIAPTPRACCCSKRGATQPTIARARFKHAVDPGKVAASNCANEDASGSKPPLPTGRNHGHASACEVSYLFPEPLCAVARPDRNADGRDRRRSAVRCLRR